MAIENSFIVNDVTKMNPIQVAGIVEPTTLEEIVDAVKRYPSVSIGGGRYSMGGQTALAGAVQIDMRRFNRIVEFLPQQRRITVQAGACWRDIQDEVDKAGSSIKIMQTYSNFTVGGALSVNCHGRYVGYGPIVLSVIAIKIVLANGEVVEASRDKNAEIFFACIGGYGSVGIIVEATLDLAENKKVARGRVTMPIGLYRSWFFEHVRESKRAVFHNADIYPPTYTTLSAVTWSETDTPVTTKTPLIPRGQAYRLQRLIVRLIFRLRYGKQYRRYLIDRHIYRKLPVHWRNYEASYDVAELEPPFWARSAHVLQEYFIPVARFEEFVTKMSEILRRHHVNALNVSVRHAKPDPGTLLAWAPEEVFAFVLYYKQHVEPHHRAQVAVWTRELINAALSLGGRYYLPYQPHATSAQFTAAYPRSKELFELKKRLDPSNKFRNTLLDKYYDPAGLVRNDVVVKSPSNFQTVYSNTALKDRFFLFLQNVFHLFPEDKLHVLIADAVQAKRHDRDIYEDIQSRLPTISPVLGALRYSLPALKKQQREISDETVQLLGTDRTPSGYMEIGTTGRYLKLLKLKAKLSGPFYLVHETAPKNTPDDLFERRGFRQPWTFVKVENYDPIPLTVPSDSVGLVTLFIGLHHIPLEKLDDYLRSIHRVLKPGGSFVLRDHDVNSDDMRAMAGLAHDVFNAGTNVRWSENERELRLFRSIEEWKHVLSRHGFTSVRGPIFQLNDPTLNGLMLFVKE